MEIITSQKVSVAFPRHPQNFFVLDQEVVKQLIPTDCPSALAELALKCCADEAENRPTFRDVIVSLNQIRGELQLPQVSTPRRNRSMSKSKTPKSPSTPSLDNLQVPSGGSNIPASPSNRRALRCNFTEMNELALRFENELEVEETLMKLFDGNSESFGTW